MLLYNAACSWVYAQHHGSHSIPLLSIIVPVLAPQIICSLECAGCFKTQLKWAEDEQSFNSNIIRPHPNQFHFNFMRLIIWWIIRCPWVLWNALIKTSYYYHYYVYHKGWNPILIAQSCPWMNNHSRIEFERLFILEKLEMANSIYYSTALPWSNTWAQHHKEDDKEELVWAVSSYRRLIMKAWTKTCEVHTTKLSWHVNLLSLFSAQRTPGQ